MAPLLHIRAGEDARNIEVIRGDDVPDNFWLTVRAEWGSTGRRPAQAITVPVERFLAQIAWLGPACRRYGVGLDWDERTRGLVGSSNRERRELDEALNGPPVLTPEQAVARLDGTRFSRSLKDFQARDLGRLLSLGHGANFSVPGAGKTTVQYAVYEAERAAGRVEQMLVVAPLSAFDAWTTEAGECFDDPPVVHRFADSIPADTEVLVVNYQRLASYYETFAEWVTSRPTLVVLDEAHRMKRGWAGEWGSACLSLAYLAERRDILTGTPAPQGTLDMATLIDYLWPNQARRILPADTLVTVPPPDAGHRIAQRIHPLFVRTTKRELGLEDTDSKIVPVELEGLQRDIYRALRDQYAGAFDLDSRDRVTLAQMGEIVMYLLEAATNPALLVAGSSSYDPIEFRHPPLEIPADAGLGQLIVDYHRYETPAKYRTLAGMLRDNASDGRKTLVWSNFVRNLETLHKRDLIALQPAMIHGGIPSEISAPRAPLTREQEIARFREDPNCKVLLANPAAMSEGISLHDICHDAIYLDRTFNAGQFLQSVDRIHRLGLKPGTETRIRFLVTKGTVDEVVDRRVTTKASRLGEMLNDTDIVTMALPDDEDYGAVIDAQEDLEALFTHLRGEPVASAS